MDNKMSIDMTDSTKLLHKLKIHTTLEDELSHWFGQKFISEKYIAENPYSETANERLYHCVNMCFRLKFEIEEIGFSENFSKELDDFLYTLEKGLK